jgi:hypothetical protein
MTAHDVLALAAIAFGVAIAATQVRHDVVLPFFVAAIVLMAIGLTAYVRRSLLLEDAARDRDAYALDAVRRYAAPLTTSERRRDEAAAIRRLLAHPELAIAERVEANRARLEEIAAELSHDELSLDPVCAVALDRLLVRPDESALYNEELPPECVRSRLVQIEAGFQA